MSTSTDIPVPPFTSDQPQNETEIRQCWFSSATPRTIDDFRYDKSKKIGEGTYGTVFRAEDKLTDEVVALKQVEISHKESGVNVIFYLY